VASHVVLEFRAHLAKELLVLELLARAAAALEDRVEVVELELVELAQRLVHRVLRVDIVHEHALRLPDAVHAVLRLPVLLPAAERANRDLDAAQQRGCNSAGWFESRPAASSGLA
jgi:hypothetical protein